MNLNEIQAHFLSKEPGFDFSKLIARERSTRWVTAKDFWNSKKELLCCTYNRYSVIEAGKAKPSLDLARRIIEALEIDESTALHAWVRDLMPDNLSKSYFIDLQSSLNTPTYRAIAITEEQSKSFRDCPLSNEIAVYISMYSGKGVTLKELALEFAMKKSELKPILQKLINNSIVRESKGTYSIYEHAWINIPDFSEFRESRNRNFELSINSHFSTNYTEEITIEQSTTRLLSKKQINLVRQVARGIARWITLLPEDFKNGIPYRFFCGGNISKHGNNRVSIAPDNRTINDSL